MPRKSEFDEYDEDFDVEVIEPEADIIDEIAAARALVAAADERDERAAADSERRSKGNRAQRRARPANAPVPQDRKPKAKTAALEAEASDEGVLFEYGGIDYVGPRPGRTKGLVKAVAARDAERMLLSILGPEQLQVFEDTDPYDAEYMELFSAWSAEAGFETPGN